MAQDEFLGEMMCSALTRERTKLTTLLLFGVIRRELSEYHVREGLGEEENEVRGNGEGLGEGANEGKGNGEGLEEEENEVRGIGEACGEGRCKIKGLLCSF